ncbi:MAG: glutamine synthetase III [Kiritimatiellae bacterium]|nr:glutamine synthetase III [Kiritimatiellia bacterium]MBQ3746551.1 glutamine synthetase III [Kiritimatiellia bacterium]
MRWTHSTQIKRTTTMTEETKSATHFGEDVFGDEAIRTYLSKDTAKKLQATIQEGKPLDPSIAGEVAHGIRHWAMDRGATHYTHWFLPMTGSTAEKHDSFLELKDGAPIMQFSGKNLIVGEPDASSFPSGGIRSTFEARGYTAWDPTSPAFIKRHSNGATLCIPTAFCAYTGESLDKKTPLLRSMQALDRSLKRLMKLFGRPEAHTGCTLGAEQEYFLIDKEYWKKRPDLVLTGRTLFGAPSAKGQQLEDHYFGTIPDRVISFMNDVERELWKLGIPAKTRHNEVAPAQFELAPQFEELNLASDHNMLVMDTLRNVAEKHGLKCLLHEKPYAGVNGSGKHNNWSVAYGGRNLLDPGSDPHENAVFLTMLCAVIEAVDKHADLLRASVAGAGNDHRLGANEAPPAVISVYVGDQLAEVLDRIENPKGAKHEEKGSLKIGVDTLPAIPKDATDRNRTSPFAFTGNKFEFRAPGSSVCCSGPMTVLNTIVAEAVDRIAGELEAAKVAGKAKPGEHTAAFHIALQKILQSSLKAHKRVIFNGNGYEADWPKEAEKRGLPNAPDTLSALAALSKKENIALFEKYGVMTKRELTSRREIFLEEYANKVRIEGNTALDMARTMILPAVRAEYLETAKTYNETDSSNVKIAIDMLHGQMTELGTGLVKMKEAIDYLQDALKNYDTADTLARMSELRKIADSLEAVVSNERWPLPKYREMLFLY